MIKCALVALALLLPQYAVAASKSKIVGSWITTSDVDPMDDTAKTIALTPDNDKDYAFGVRCFNKDLSYMLVPTNKDDNGFTDGTMYEIKLRPDSGNVTTFKGIGNESGSLLIEESEDIFRTILNANAKFALRVTSEKEGRQRDLIFNVGSSKAALTPIRSQCAIK